VSVGCGGAVGGIGEAGMKHVHGDVVGAFGIYWVTVDLYLELLVL
jgi:hypothetical protein